MIVRAQRKCFDLTILQKLKLKLRPLCSLETRREFKERRLLSSSTAKPPSSALYKKIMESHPSKREAVKFIEQKFCPNNSLMPRTESKSSRIPISLILHYPSSDGNSPDLETKDWKNISKTTQKLMQTLAVELSDLKKLGLHPVILAASTSGSSVIAALVESLHRFTELKSENGPKIDSDEENNLSIMSGFDSQIDVQEFTGLTSLLEWRNSSKQHIRLDVDQLKQVLKLRFENSDDEVEKLTLPILTPTVIDSESVSITALDDHAGYLQAAKTILEDIYNHSELFIERVVLLVDRPFWSARIAPTNPSEYGFAQSMLRYLSHSASIAVFSILTHDSTSTEDAFSFLVKDWVRDKPSGQSGALAAISQSDDDDDDAVDPSTCPQYITMRPGYPIVEYTPTQNYSTNQMCFETMALMSHTIVTPLNSRVSKCLASARTLGVITDESNNLDLHKLQELLSSSFGKPLDIFGYFASLQHDNGHVKRRLERVIVVNDYQAAAVLTREFPNSSQDDGESFVYLDKFAVGPGSQGTGLADILWDRVCAVAPSDRELVWRSRSSNIVNKWYFERSTDHIKGGYWSFFYLRGTKQLASTGRIQVCYEHCMKLPATFT